MATKGGLIYAFTMSIILAAVLIYAIRNNNHKKIIQRNESFSGTVQKFEFIGKSYPTMTVNDVDYQSSYLHDIQFFIQVDDSVVKQKDSLNYMVYRKDEQGEWELIYRQKED